MLGTLLLFQAILFFQLGAFSNSAKAFLFCGIVWNFRKCLQICAILNYTIRLAAPVSTQGLNNFYGCDAQSICLLKYGNCRNNIRDIW